MLSEEQLLEACSIAGTCSPEVMSLDLETRLALVDMCIGDLVYSAERAIPITGWNNGNERAEYWVGCVLGHEQQCDVVNTCRTGRDASIYCKEDGCTGSLSSAVQCNAEVASMHASGGVVVRDCALAYAQCDPTSPTGCTDRPFTQCAAEPPLPDRCDGDIRIGCDSGCHVSYHDCSRMGGTCGTTPEGGKDCIYPAPRSPECTAVNAAPAACASDLLSACVNGRRISLASALCPTTA